MFNKKALILFSSLTFLFSCSSNVNLNNLENETSISSNQVNKNYIPWGTEEKDWGKHSQIASTYEELNDIKGNKDGIWDNEKGKSGVVDGIGISAPLRPLFERGSKLLQGELSPTNLIKALSNFRKEQEQKWGKSVTTLNLKNIKHGKLFAVQKSIYLTRLNRNPSQVIDGFVKASGSVDGNQIDDREIFYQRFKPTSSANGKIAVISPGFLESGRNFYEQADILNKKGFDVIIMDHQWAGYTKGGKDGLADRGYGVARDTAVMTAFAKNILDSEYSSYAKKEVLIIGNSMGAGPGALGAITLNDNGKMKLNGYKMPEGVNVVLQAPFLGSTESIINSGLSFFAKVPFAKNIALYNIGIPILTHNKIAAQKGMQISLLEDTRAQASTMISSNKDIESIIEMIKSGIKPKGKISIVHADKDPLANSEKSLMISKFFDKSQFTLKIINSDNHVFEQNPEEQFLAIDATLRIN